MQLFQIVPFPSSAMVTIGYIIIRIISAQCCYGVTPAVQCGNVGPRLEMENVTEEYNWTDIPEYNVAILVREFPLSLDHRSHQRSQIISESNIIIGATSDSVFFCILHNLRILSARISPVNYNL